MPRNGRVLPPLPWREAPGLRKLTEPVMRIALGARHKNLPEAVLADLVDVIPGVGDYANYVRMTGSATLEERGARGKRWSAQAADYMLGQEGVDTLMPGLGTIMDIVTPTNTLLYLDEKGRLPEPMKKMLQNLEPAGQAIGSGIEVIHSAVDLTKLPVPLLSSGVARTVNAVGVQPMVCASRGHGPIRCLPQMWDQFTGQWTVRQDYPYARGKRPLRDYFADTKVAAQGLRRSLPA